MGSFERNAGSDIAAGLTFYFIFSLFPLVLALVAVFGLFVGRDSVRERVIDFLVGSLPVGRGLVSSQLETVVAARSTVGVVGGVGLLWSASAAFGLALRAVDRAFVPTRDRNFATEKLLAMCMALGIGGSMLLATVSTEALGLVERFAPQEFILRWGLEQMLGIWPRVVDVGVDALGVGLLYWISPTRRPKPAQIWPEAVAVALVLHSIRALFVYYVTEMAHYGAVYGSLGSVIAVLMWILVTANVVIFGAEVCAARSRFRA